MTWRHDSSRKKATKAIGDFFGKFVQFDENNYDGWCKTFLRIRVENNVNQPLRSKIRIKIIGGEWAWISFRYERLLHFCFVCGLIGHTKKFCPKSFEGAPLSTKKEYGPWIPTTNCHVPPTIGNRWLVSDQVSIFGISLTKGHSGSMAVPDGGGSTVHINRPDIKDGSTTEISRDGQVSAIPTTRVIENKTAAGDIVMGAPGDIVMGQVEDKQVEIGLTLLDQKRRRVDTIGLELVPISQVLDISTSSC